ncbi:T3SS effector HopA1 family protein [Nocardioides zeae]|uniref:T3SS effector HopA1 family protein n=1 Tax=Nocardioides imazamoxiresistens TaxID=3231893 RepID=A0ABU3PV93_9ACTN|nr:T3SS effector HopA1 family protein [Nocardioides zeae]MDT9593135.1 T3SS effector HopA1 family protein [Nocardioides zeae]
MSTLTAPPLAPPVTPPAALLAALDEVAIDTATWTARVGTRDVPGGSPRDLRAHLVAVLYEVLHAGRAEEKDLGRVLREHDVEQVLAAAIPHPTSPRAARLVRHLDPADGADPSADPGSTGDAVVDLGDVRVRVPAAVVPAGWEVGEVRVLDLPAGRPALSHGFFMVDGPLGMPRAADGLRRVYVHAVDHDAAATAWRRAMTALNAVDAPYRTKTLSHRDGYPRRDAIVVYLPAAAADLAGVVAEAVAGLPRIADDTSLFAERLAPGVAIADDPADPRPQYRELSFGEHRASIAATAVVRRADAADPASDLAAIFAEECDRAGVLPATPAFNAPASAADAAA